MRSIVCVRNEVYGVDIKTMEYKCLFFSLLVNLMYVLNKLSCLYASWIQLGKVALAKWYYLWKVIETALILKRTFRTLNAFSLIFQIQFFFYSFHIYASYYNYKILIKFFFMFRFYVRTHSFCYYNTFYYWRNKKHTTWLRDTRPPLYSILHIAWIRFILQIWLRSR